MPSLRWKRKRHRAALLLAILGETQNPVQSLHGTDSTGGLALCTTTTVCGARAIAMERTHLQDNGSALRRRP